MKKFTATLGILACFAIFATQVRAQSTSNKIGNGAEALATCSSQEIRDYVFCQGFIRGYVSALAMSGYSDENPYNKNPKICLPQNVWSDKWQKDYVDFLRASPDDLEVEAGLLLFGMFIKKYPCAKRVRR